MEISYGTNDFYTVSSSELSGNNIVLKDAWDSKYAISEDEYMEIELEWKYLGVNVDYDEMYALKEKVYK